MLEKGGCKPGTTTIHWPPQGKTILCENKALVAEISVNSQKLRLAFLNRDLYGECDNDKMTKPSMVKRTLRTQNPLKRLSKGSKKKENLKSNTYPKT